jgi:flagellar biosynthesis anti-sigma factor FlgM
MDIDTRNAVKPVSAVAKRPTEPVATATPRAGETEQPGELLSMSLASLLKEAQEMTRQLPEVDAARVAEIKTRIEQGEYPIDPVRVARRMMEHESAFSSGERT